jgi:hypothetical protein
VALGTRSGFLRGTAASFNANRAILSPRVRLSEIAGTQLKIVSNWEDGPADGRSKCPVHL